MVGITATNPPGEEEGQMNKWIVLLALIGISAGPAFADVSNEMIVGIEGDSTREVTQSVGGISVDLGGVYETRNSQLGVQYTRFIDPLKDDDNPIDLRRFLQHPDTFTAGLFLFGQTVEDNRNPFSREEDKLSASMLVVGGEYYFPTETGLFLNVGGGSGTQERTVNGVSQPDWDASVGMYEFGVRQYLVPNVELHLTFEGQSVKLEQGGQEYSQKKSVALLGAQGVINNTVGLMLELGGGKRTDGQTGAADIDYDVAQVNFAIAVYAGKQFSVQLDAEAESAKERGSAAGTEYTETTARGTLSASYWFTERFGLSLPVYAETDEQKMVVGSVETKLTVKNSGAGLYAAFRF